MLPVSLLRRLFPHSTLFVKNAFGGFPSPAFIPRGLSILPSSNQLCFFAHYMWNRTPFSPSRSFQTPFSVCRRALNSSTSTKSIKPFSNLPPCCCSNMSDIMHFLLGSSTRTVLMSGLLLRMTIGSVHSAPFVAYKPAAIFRLLFTLHHQS